MNRSFGEVGFVSTAELACSGAALCEERTLTHASAHVTPLFKILQGLSCPFKLLILDYTSALGFLKH